MSELIIKLNLDYQDESGQFIDSSSHGYSVTTSDTTTPTLVDDSQFFSVASFDGTDDFISLPTASTLNLTDNSFSVEAWVYIDDAISDISSSGDLTILGSLYATSSNVLQLTIQDGKPHMGFTAIETTAEDTTLTPGNWYHLAWVYDADAKTQTIYLNAAMIAQGTNKDAFTSTAALRVGQSSTGSTFFDGKLAMLRIYQGVLSVAEIKRDMYQDNPSYTFNSTYPIDFSLFDKDEANTLYIEDDPADQFFTLEIYNHATETVVFQSNDDAVSNSNYHFALKFRPQTLAEESLSGDSPIALSDSSSWQLLLESAEDNENQKDVVYLLRTTDTTLVPGETLSIELKNVGASGSQGARGTQVELVTDNIAYSTDPDTVLQLNRVNHLSVINHRGEDDIPLHVGFVGPNTVLNNGSVSTDTTLPQLKLRLTNTNTNTSKNTTNIQGNDINFLLKEDDDDTSKIIINFDTDTDNSAENVWALGSSTQIGDITITPPDNWTVQFVDGELPEWVLRPSADQVLAVDDELEIGIGNIVTSHPTGPTHVYLNYHNIPGYWDGKLVAVIQKQPLVFYGENVGIGVEQPTARLEVAGSFSAESISTDGSLSAGSISTNSILSGERGIYTEAPSSFDASPSDSNSSAYLNSRSTYRYTSLANDTAIDTGLCYRIAQNPASQEPIFQVRSQGQYVRFFVEHDGWTGSARNPAWFGHSSAGLNNYFADAMQIGGDYDSKLTASNQLYVDGDSQITGALTVAKVGIGTTTPSRPLAIRGQGSAEELISFENPEGTTKWHINQNYRGESPGLNFVETGVADGRLFIQAGGNVGIGTINPTNAALEVSSHVARTVNATFGYLGPNGSSKSSFNGKTNWGIYTPHSIGAYDFLAHSDVRIKNIQGISNSTEDLQTLLLIEITNYTLKDTIGKGNDAYKKVIAQQVKSVYPQAVNKQITQAIPDIYKRSKVRNGWILLETDLQTGQRVKIIAEDKEETYEVLEVEASRFRLAAEALPKEVFVYGQEVDDFHTVDYEAIAMLNVSATQELHKRIEGLTEENQSKDLQLQELTRGLDQQHQIIQSQQEMIEKITSDLQQVMQQLEISLVSSNS